jgi:hypothetical protein
MCQKLNTGGGGFSRAVSRGDSSGGNWCGSDSAAGVSLSTSHQRGSSGKAELSSDFSCGGKAHKHGHCISELPPPREGRDFFKEYGFIRLLK